MSVWSDAMTLFSALAGQDSFDIRNALRPNSMYILAAIYLLISGWIMAWI